MKAKPININADFRRIDNSDVFVWPDIHDGFLTGLILPDENTLELHFLSLAQQKFILSFPDLLALKAENFRQGNIILDVMIYRKEVCPLRLLGQAFGYDDLESDRYLPDRLKELEQYEWSLLELTGSYGCDLLALFKTCFFDHA